MTPKKIILLSAVLLIFDQLTKIVVKTSMTLGESINVFGSWFQILFIENNGAAYGMELGGEWGKLALSLFRIVAVVFIAIYISRLIKKKVNVGVVVAFTFILVGALGNIVDSAFYGLFFSESTPTTVAHFTTFGQGYGTFLHGKVVDMLHFPIIDIEMMPEWIPIWGGKPFLFFAPIFNVADSYITCSLVYLIIFQRKFFQSEPKKEIA